MNMKITIIPRLQPLFALIIAKSSAESSDAQLVITCYPLNPNQIIFKDPGTLTFMVKDTGDEAIRIHSVDLESPSTGISGIICHERAPSRSVTGDC